jgi:predicted dehydrogenase
MKVAIIGCGYVAPGHIWSLKRIPDIDIVGVADINVESAQKVAKKFGITKAFADTRSILAQTKPDVVHILTPPQTHVELSLEVMQAGTHVLLEKPMAPCVEEADKILEGARKYKVKLGLCHNFLFIPCVVAAKRMLAQGELGELVGVDITWKPVEHGLYMDWTSDLPGGALHEVLPHPVYVQRAFVGNFKGIAGITRRGGDSRGPRCEIRVLLDAEKGTSQIEVSPRIEPKQMWMRIKGTKMSLTLDIGTNTLVKVRKRGNGIVAKALMNVDQAVQLLGGTAGSALTLLRGGYSNGHLPLIEAFYQSLREGTEPPVTGEDGRETVAILDQIWARMSRNNDI